jgi:hypothetical protein
MRLAFRDLPYGASGENLTVAGATEDSTCLGRRVARCCSDWREHLVGLLRRA